MKKTCPLGSPGEYANMVGQLLDLIVDSGFEENPEIYFIKLIKSIAANIKKTDLNTYINIINDLLKDDFNRQCILWNPSEADIEAVIKGNYTKLESDNSKSKTDGLDPNENILVSKSDTFISDVYGTSTAKDVLERFIKQKYPSLFFIDFGAKTEITDLESVNKQINNYLKDLFDIVVNYFNPIINDPDFSKLKLTGQDDLNKLNKMMQPQMFNYSIRHLQSLTEDSMYDKEAKNKLDALNALFILNNFDKIIKIHNKKSIEINHSFGVINLSKNKYSINLANENQTSSWRDEDKDIDAVAETNNVVKMLIEMFPSYNYKTKYRKGNENLDIKAVALTNTRIRKLMNNPLARVYLEVDGKLKDLYKELNAIEPNFVEKYLRIKEGNYVQYKTLQDLICDFFGDSVEAARILYTVLLCNSFKSKCNDLGLYDDDLNIIYSMYLGVFAPPKVNPNSLYSIYLHTLRNTDSVDSLHKYYYTFVTQFLNTQEMIESLEYERLNGSITNKTLIENNNIAKTFFINNQLSGKFNLDKLPKFKNFKIDDKGLIIEKKAKKIDPYIDFETTVDGKLYRFRKFGKSKNVKAFRVELSKEIPVSIKGIFPEIRNMLSEILGFNFSDNFINTLKNYQESLYAELTLNMVGNILYNYSLSRYLDLNKPIIAKNPKLIKSTLEVIEKNKKGKDLGLISTGSIKDIFGNVEGATEDTLLLVLSKSGVEDSGITDWLDFYTDFKEKQILGGEDTLLSWYKLTIKNYYNDDNMPTITDSKQIPYINKLDTPIKTALIKANNSLKGVISDNTLKDAKGKQITSTSLDLLSTKVWELFRRSNKKNAALKEFSINKAYVGLEFARDFKGPNGSKAATKFSEAENFIGGFLYDYLNRTVVENNEDLKNKELNVVKLTPSIISDKSRIMKTLFDLNLDSPITIKDEKTGNIVHVPFKDLTTEQFLELAVKELGNYYESIYNNLKQSFDTLNNHLNTVLSNNKNYQKYLFPLLTLIKDNPKYAYIDKMDTILEKIKEIVKLLNFNPNDNFKQINTFLSDLFINANGDANYKQIDTFINNLIHDTLIVARSKGSLVELTQRIHYTTKEGIHGNALLFDLLYRWDKIRKSSDAYKEYGLNTGYGTYKEFFKKKLELYLGDLIKDNCEIRTNDSLFNAFKDPAFKAFSKGWITGENVILGKINYNYINSLTGEITEKSLYITDKDSFRDSYIYRQVAKFKHYQSEINIDDPKFNFGDFIEAIKEYNTYHAVDVLIRHNINTLIKPLVESKVKDETKLTEIIEDIKNNLASETVINEILETGKFPKLDYTPKISGLKKALEKVTKIGGIENYGKVTAYMELNPNLAKYQSVDFLFSLEYMNATVGTHINHKGSGKTLIEQESSAWGQQVKRNVSMTASKHKFTPNLIDGIREKYLIAVVEDDFDFVCNVAGKKGSVKPFDGATYCSITTNYLENNSLKGDKAGIDKKQFIHDYKANSGTGIVVKTAGFAVTNGRMRDSLFYQRMNKKLLGLKFRDLNGKEIYPDITTDWRGEKITPERYGNIIYKENGNIYRVVDLSYNNGKTLIKREILTKDGWKNSASEDLSKKVRESLDKVEILKTNHDVWLKVFGGAYSLQLHTNDIESATSNTGYTFNEASCVLLTYAMNNVGNKTKELIYKLDNHIYRINEATNNGSTVTINRSVLTEGGWINLGDIVITKDTWEKELDSIQLVQLSTNNISSATLQTKYSIKGKLTFNSLDTKVTSQKDLDQVMKRAVIDYIVTEGAIKLGAANVNSREAYFDDDYELTTMELGMYDSGTQLDAEHNADESVLSLMTLVLNALGARGYSATPASDTYKALRSLTKETLKNFDLGKIGLAKGDPTKMLEFLADVILKSIMSTNTETDGNLIAALSKNIRKAYNEGDKVTYELIRKYMPISNPGTFSKMVTQLASLLTKKCVRIKFPGSMDVLSPSNKIYRLYNDLMLSAYEGDLSKVPEYAQPCLVRDIRLGRTYKITYVDGKSEELLIDDPDDYYRIKDSIGNIVSVEENLRVGRELASYNVKITGTDGVNYNIWDLDSIKKLYTLDNPLHKIVDTLNKGKAANIIGLAIKMGSNTSSLEDSQEFLLLKLAELFSEVLSLGYEGEFDYNKIHKFLMRKLQNSLTNLSENQIVSIEGRLVLILSKEIIPYELIMTKIYATTFGLKVGDNVGDILNDREFFIRRMCENWLPKATQDCFDIELKNINGNHTYLLYDNEGITTSVGGTKNTKSYLELQGFVKIETNPKWDGDTLYQHNELQEKVRKLSSEEDEVWSNGVTEIIVSKNLGFYVEDTNFMNIGLSKNISDDTLKETIILLLDSKKNAVKGMLNNLAGDNIDKLRLYKEDESNDGEILLNDIVTNAQTFIAKVSENVEKEIKELQKAPKGALLDPNYVSDNFHSRAIKNIIEQGLEVHTSFLKSLKVLAARIPAQSHQSFMAMKVVGFDDSGKNTAYVNRMLLWLQGSDYDIDKVSLLGYKFRWGKFIKWSPLMDLHTKEFLEASENLPFPTGNEMQIVPVNENSKERDELIQYALELMSIKKYSPEKIKTWSKIIRIVNKIGYIPTIGDSNIENYLLEHINEHNLYLLDKHINTKDALINFISTTMYNVSADPINLILGQAPIDDATDVIKDIANTKPMSIKSILYSPGSPQTKIEQLILTLTGKENTGIVASAMKNYEACSLYYYKMLNEGDEISQKRLLSNFTVLGKLFKLLANAYARNLDSVKSLEVLEALDSVDNDLDTFIMFSALLSLSTDNAKDPTLAKINAGPSMMSLYTAGLMVGLDVTTLIEIMTSKFGWIINELMQSNVFNDTEGFYSIDSIFTYLKLGPMKEYKLLPIQIKEMLKTIVFNYLKNKENKKKDTGTKNKKALNRDDLDDFTIVGVIKSKFFNLQAYLSGQEVDLENEKNNIILEKIKYLDYKIKALEEKEKLTEKGKIQLAKLQELKSIYDDLKKGKNLEDFPVERQELVEPILESVQELALENKQTKEIDLNGELKELNKLNFLEKHKDRFRRFLKAIRKYKRIRRIAEKEKIKSPFNDVEYNVKDVIYYLNLVANELARLRPVLALNLSLPNALSDLLKFLRNFESIFEQRLSEIPKSKAKDAFIDNFKKTLGTEEISISLQSFVDDADYRLKVIQLYDEIKVAVNIFDVVSESDHYFGYLESVNALVSLGEMSSKIYDIANTVSKNVLTKYIQVSSNSKVHDDAIKKTLKFVISRLNNQFMLSLNVVITIDSGTIYDNYGNEIPANKTEIVLGTPAGNASFKRWMEELVIPEDLKVNYSLNDFIKLLTEIGHNKTFDLKTSYSYALNGVNLMPKSESERNEFKRYKDALSMLLSYNLNKFKNATDLTVLDLIFYYNLIAYNGESGLNAFTSLFEDIYAENLSEVASSYIEFYSIFDKEGSFELGVDFTEEELLKYIAPKANPESAKLPFIRVFNPNTMEYELAKATKKKDKFDLQNNPELENFVWEMLLDYEQQENPGDEENPNEGNFNESKGLTLEERLENNNYALVKDSISYPRDFTLGFVEESHRIALSGNISIVDKDFVVINKRKYSLKELAELGVKNGYKVTAKDIIKSSKVKTSLGTLSRINQKLTLKTIEKLLETNLCE